MSFGFELGLLSDYVPAGYAKFIDVAVKVLQFDGVVFLRIMSNLMSFCTVLRCRTLFEFPNPSVRAPAAQLPFLLEAIA